MAAIFLILHKQSTKTVLCLYHYGLKAQVLNFLVARYFLTVFIRVPLHAKLLLLIKLVCVRLMSLLEVSYYAESSLQGITTICVRRYKSTAGLIFRLLSMFPFGFEALRLNAQCMWMQLYYLSYTIISILRVRFMLPTASFIVNSITSFVF